MKRLGDVLIEENLISPQQLGLILKEQKRTDELLGDVVLRLGILTRKELSRVIALTSDISFVDLRSTHIDPAAVQTLPKDIAKRFKLIPYSRIDNNTLKVAMDNPSDIVAIDTIRRTTGKNIEVVTADLESILESIEVYYEVGTSIDDEIDKNTTAAMTGGLAEGEVTAPIIRLVELLLIKSLRSQATDLHITPQEMATRVSLRIDGILRSGNIIPSELHSALVTRIKVMSSLNIAEQRLPQEGNMDFEFSGRKVDIRASTSPTNFGENVVLRILDKANIVLGLDYLGLSGDDITTIRKLSLKPHGILLVAGPTGSGKTTTLYSMLREINALEKNVMTIEDPIEYHLPLIKQAQVNEQSGLTFERAIRHFLRQDPDIILVGEIRDLETVKIAFRAAMTGHLVLSTIHTNDASSTMARLLDLGVEPYLIPTTLRAVVAQRLIRKLCINCIEEYVPTEEEYQIYDLANWSEKGKPLKRSTGCKHCDYTGYRGRSGIFEIMEVTPKLSTLISQKTSADMLRLEAQKEGMLLMRLDGLKKVLAGETSLEEIARVT